jgi:IS605 OrfB family transposase
MKPKKEDKKPTVTRALRIPVYFPQLPEKTTKEERTDFFGPLQTLQKDLTRASNRLSTFYYFLQTEQLPRPKKDTGEDVPLKTLAYRAFNGEWQPFGRPLYKATTKHPPSSALLLGASGRVYQRIQTDKAEITAGKKSLATFRLVPLTFPAQTVRFEREGTMLLPLWAHEAKQKRLEIGLAFGARDHGAQAIYTRIKTGVYKLGSVQLFQDKRTNRWTASISYTQPVESIMPASPCIVGIDSGIAASATLACVNAKGEVQSNRATLNLPADLDRALMRIFRRKQQTARTARPRGRGRKRALRGVHATRDAYARRVQDAVRRLAAAIVKKVQQFGATSIHMEQLTHWSQDAMLKETAALEGKSRRWRRRFFTRWRHAALVEAVQCAAEKVGIAFILVDAAMTSKTCSACGVEWSSEAHVASRSTTEDGRGYGRLSQREWRCSCGFEDHADHNAAVNIARRAEAAENTSSPRARRPVTRPDGETANTGGATGEPPRRKVRRTAVGKHSSTRERPGAASPEARARTT